MLAASLVDSVLGRFGYAAVFAFVGIESLGIPLPGETMLIAAGLYAGTTHNLSIEVIVIAAASGAIIGDNIGFGIGHWGGYRLLLRYGRYIRVDESRIKIARYLFMRHGGKVVFFGRFVSVLRTYAAFLAGTARMSWPPFLLFNATGGIFWAVAWSLGAYFAGAYIQSLSTPVNIALGILAVVVIVVFTLVLRREEKNLSVEAERAFPGPLQAP
ncbi:MAG: DedA family protein [Candidatus Dormibacteraeota bacterium]|uniref:DedA family protein n=1 Tax=Candidatus Amunia macphersoniae TaxID=3127014 RepID=A0A934KJX1_9BACT|nr:DedA family protein [Candidatus Dormibacteraeota bacterium]